MHFVVAVFANKDQLFDEESFERFSKIEKGEKDDNFKELHTKLSKRMEDLVYNKSLKYVESGVDEEWDQWLKDNNLLVYNEEEKTEDNPNSFWDWYSIGGRWLSLCQLYHYTPVKNMDINKASDDFYGFIDLEGNYFSQDDFLGETKEEFKVKLKEYLKSNPEAYLIVVDYHG